MIAGRYDLDGIVLGYAGAIIGIVAASPDETAVAALLMCADAAMYKVTKVRKPQRT